MENKDIQHIFKQTPFSLYLSERKEPNGSFEKQFFASLDWHRMTDKERAPYINRCIDAKLKNFKEIKKEYNIGQFQENAYFISKEVDIKEEEKQGNKNIVYYQSRNKFSEETNDNSDTQNLFTPLKKEEKASAGGSGKKKRRNKKPRRVDDNKMSESFTSRLRKIKIQDD